jgi:hypothetical protein
VGGQVADIKAARPLANIPLVWMLTKLEACGLVLPPDWETRFRQDVTAPSVGTWRKWGKVFWSRRCRIVLANPSETIHLSVSDD